MNIRYKLRTLLILLAILRLGQILSVGFEQILLQRDFVGPDAGEVLDPEDGLVLRWELPKEAA